MRIYIKILFAALAGALALNSCLIEDSSVNANYKSELVVEALFSPDSIWTVYVGRTDGDFNANFEDLKVENANVYIKNLEDFKPIPLNYIGDGYYKAVGFKPEEGFTYQVTVEAPGFKTVIADSYVPKIFAVDSSNVNVIYDPSSKNYQVVVDFDISQGSEKYFFWDFYLVNTSPTSAQNPENPNNDLIEPEYNNIPKFNPTNFDWMHANIITDGTVSATIHDNYDGEQNPNSSSGSERSLVVYVVASSIHLYDYYINQSESEVNPSTLVAPTTYYSNISDGYGIFGGYNEKYFSLPID